MMKKKVVTFDTFYHGPQGIKGQKEFYYERNWGLKKFKLTHPKVMSQWIEKNRDSLDLFSLPLSFGSNLPGLIISDTIEKLTGYRIGEYKNYKRC